MTLEVHEMTPAERRVLVVDDNPAVVRLIGALFQDEGMTVRLATSVAEAREILTREKGAFDLVLSDISMPVETGFDLLQWIKDEKSPYRDLPVLLTTAQLPEAENRMKGLAMGAVDYVVRPIELRELVLRSIHAIDHFQRVKSLENSLKSSENLAMVGQMMAASNHEIRNLAMLVNVCASQLQRALKDQNQSAHVAKAMTGLSEASSLLADVTRNVSSLLDPKSLVVKPVDLRGLAHSVTELMAIRVKPCLLQLDQSAGGKVFAKAHSVRVKQVLINLILNGADAIHELQSDLGGSIHVSVGQSESTAWISVKDTGIGFATAGVRRDFRAFETTKKLRGGQGLGLWLCSKLVQGMGGVLTLESAGVGRGAKATIELPRCEPVVESDDEFSLGF